MLGVHVCVCVFPSRYVSIIIKTENSILSCTYPVITPRGYDYNRDFTFIYGSE